MTIFKMNTGLWAGFWTWLIGKEKEDISEEEGTEEELKKDWPQKRGLSENLSGLGKG